MGNVGGRIGELAFGQRPAAPVGVLLTLVELHLEATLEQHAEPLTGADPDEPGGELDIHHALRPRAELHAQQRQVR